MEFPILSKTPAIELGPIIHGQPDTPILDMKSSQHYKKCRGCSVQCICELFCSNRRPYASFSPDYKWIAISHCRRILYQDLVSWSTVIAAYAQSGSAKEALQLFYQMQCKGLHPDEFVFLSILCACSHAGLVDEGCQYFISFLGDYGALMMAEHYGCVVAILGHAGMLDEAEDFITKVAFEDKHRDIVAWSALLGGCEMFGDVRRGKQVAKHILELDPTNASAYTVLSNIYAAAKCSMEE